MAFYNRWKNLAFTGSIIFFLSGVGIPASAVTITTDTSITDSISGFSAFETTGASMTGLNVTAVFSDGSSDTRSWETTGTESSGGAFGTITGGDWSLAVDGDTNNVLWQFANDTELALMELVLDGEPGFVIFDRQSPGSGTVGSASGRDFAAFDLSVPVQPIDNIAVEYARPVKLDNAAAPVGDTWHMLTVDLSAVGQDGLQGGWQFLQDTDNDIRITAAPEPATIFLFSVALVGIGWWRKHAHN